MTENDTETGRETATGLLEAFLRQEADKLAPLDKEYPDVRGYHESVVPEALTGEWLDARKSYIWKVGVLAQWDSNKCDWARIFIGQERQPGDLQFIGVLHWSEGENADIGRCLQRYVDVASWIHPVFGE